MSVEELENDEAPVLPDAAKRRNAIDYVIVVREEDIPGISLITVDNWADVKKKANDLPVGCSVVEVLRVTARFQPQVKTVVHF